MDLSKIPLRRIRGETISIIPQDAHLFGGSVRDNLDPFLVHSDEALWATLKRAYMHDIVRSMAGLVR
jgi:ATP-binding cassette subfamily C (CFTR/MRP) protein 1